VPFSCNLEDNFLEPSGPVQAFNGTPLPLPFISYASKLFCLKLNCKQEKAFSATILTPENVFSATRLLPENASSAMSILPGIKFTPVKAIFALNFSPKCVFRKALSDGN